MAQIIFHNSGYTTEADAWTNGPGSVNTIAYHFDEAAQGSSTDLEAGDVLFTDAGLTTGNEVVGGDDYWWYSINTVGYVVQISDVGVVQSPVTTTTTLPPDPIYVLETAGNISSTNWSKEIPYKVLSKLILPFPGIDELCDNKNK